MANPEDPKAKAAATYNAAADNYDDPANTFWSRFGRRTIERLELEAGARVLDVCCGAGASAIPAAESIGEHGYVLGIDLADNLLTLAREKAQAKGLTNIQFRVDRHPIPSAEAWWAAVLGSGYRGTIDQLSTDECEEVRVVNMNFINGSGIQEVEANVVYSVASKT